MIYTATVCLVKNSSIITTYRYPTIPKGVEKNSFNVNGSSFQYELFKIGIVWNRNCFTRNRKYYYRSKHRILLWTKVIFQHDTTTYSAFLSSAEFYNFFVHDGKFFVPRKKRKKRSGCAASYIDRHTTPLHMVWLISVHAHTYIQCVHAPISTVCKFEFQMIIRWFMIAAPAQCTHPLFHMPWLRPALVVVRQM